MQNSSNVLPNILERRESLKSRGNTVNATAAGNSDINLNKVLTLSRMDQEILQNYKLRVNTLETELKSKKDEILSLSRNFDALCLKSKEDCNLIKKLEEEINFYKSRDKTPTRISSSSLPKYEDDNAALAKTYKEKIDSQAQIIKELESKISTAASRFSERDKFYKTYTTRLEEKVKAAEKSLEALEKEKIQQKKESDKSTKDLEKLKEDITKLASENESLIDEINRSSKELNELKLKHRSDLDSKESEFKNKLKGLNEQQRKLQNSANVEEKLRSENELFNKLINEVKLRNKQLEESYNSAKECLSNKEGQLLNISAFLQNQLPDILKSKTEEIMKRYDFLLERQTSLSEKVKILTEEKISTLITRRLKLYKSTIIELKSKVEIQSNEILKYREAIISHEKKNLGDMESKLNVKQEEIAQLKELIDNASSKLMDKDGEINLCKEEIKRLKGECDDFKKKINKLEDVIRIKDADMNDYIMNFKEIQDNEKKIKSQNESYRSLLLSAEEKIKNFDVKLLDQELKQKEKIGGLELVIEHQKEDLELIKKQYETLKNKGSGVERVKEFFNQLLSSNSKLTLGLETLSFILSCKFCSDENADQKILNCGHSICMSCTKSHTKCVECKTPIDRSHIKIENVNLNNIIKKYLFINQTKKDIEVIMQEIKDEVSRM